MIVGTVIRLRIATKMYGREQKYESATNTLVSSYYAKCTAFIIYYSELLYAPRRGAAAPPLHCKEPKMQRSGKPGNKRKGYSCSNGISSEGCNRRSNGFLV